MKEKEITTRQMIITMIMFRIALMISYMPPIELPPKNQDTLVILLLSSFYALVSSIPILFLANKFKDITMMEYFKKILGKFLGNIIIFLYGLYFMFNSLYGIVLQNKIVGVELSPNISYFTMTIPIVIFTIYVCLKGLGIIFRVGDLVSPIMLVSTIILIVLGLQNTNFNNLLPILSDSSISEINEGSFIMSFIFSNIFILVMAVPFLKENNKINKIYGNVILFSTLLSTIVVVVTQAAVEIEQARHLEFPFLIYTRLIDYRFVLQRIDPLYVVVWFYASLGRIITDICFACMAFKSIFNFKNEKIILYIISILTGLISIYLGIKGIRITLTSPFTTIRTYLTGIFTTIIPSIICIVYFFRRGSINRE